MTGTVPPGKFYFDVGNLGGSKAGEKMDYIAREDEQEQAKGREQVPVRNGAGRSMSDAEREQFIERAESNDYVQRWQVSPPNGDELSRDELRRETRRVADDYTRDKSSARVAYAVHTDQDGPNHAHVLITGNEHELRMDREDIEQTRTNAHERMTANERYKSRSQNQEQPLSERLREQSKESVKDRADEFAKNWEEQQIEDRIAAMDGSRRMHAQRRANNIEDMRQQSYEEKYGREHPAEQHHKKNFADMREQAHRERLRERQRERAEQLRKRRERERENENEKDNDNDRDRGMGMGR